MNTSAITSIIIALAFCSCKTRPSRIEIPAPSAAEVKVVARDVTREIEETGRSVVRASNAAKDAAKTASEAATAVRRIVEEGTTANSAESVALEGKVTELQETLFRVTMELREAEESSERSKQKSDELTQEIDLLEIQVKAQNVALNQCGNEIRELKVQFNEVTAENDNLKAEVRAAKRELLKERIWKYAGIAGTILLGGLSAFLRFGKAAAL